MGGKIVLWRELAASDLACHDTYVVTDFTAQSEIWAHCRIRSCQSRPSTACTRTVARLGSTSARRSPVASNALQRLRIIVLPVMATHDQVAASSGDDRPSLDIVLLLLRQGYVIVRFSLCVFLYDTCR